MRLHIFVRLLALFLLLGIAALYYLQRTQYILTSLLWVPVLFPGVFLYALHEQYRAILTGRREEIESIMSRGTTIVKYLKAFESTRGAREGSLKKTFERLFYRKYGKSKYYFPLVMNALLGGLFLLIVLSWAKLPMGLPAELTTIMHGLPPSTIAGLAGAFIWGLYDVLKRFEAVDLSPASLHSIWLRMLVASVLAPMLSAPFVDSLKPAIAFAVGLFPTKELFDFVRGQARKNLNLTMSAQPAEKPTLYRLQGSSESMVGRLIDEGIESATQLANYDPIKLLFRTNIEWKTILDIIDQAILFDYFGDKFERLRAFGIRGAIELADLHSDLVSLVPEVREQVEKLVAHMASQLEVEEAAIRNAIRNAYEDIQVQLLWELWGDPEPGEDDNAERDPEPTEEQPRS